MTFGVALTFGVILLFGLVPALRVSRVNPASALKGGDNPHSRRRLMNGLVALQVAFCFLVLFVAGLFVATFDRLSNIPTGFSAERILTLTTVTKTVSRIPSGTSYRSIYAQSRVLKTLLSQAGHSLAAGAGAIPFRSTVVLPATTSPIS